MNQTTASKEKLLTKQQSHIVGSNEYPMEDCCCWLVWYDISYAVCIGTSKAVNNECDRLHYTRCEHPGVVPKLYGYRV